MAEQLFKLSPHRDLQCYFLTPSAIAAMSRASEAGFVVSGKWRQQFDWAVVEWNRDNTFEHPAFRYLPDGDLSGLVLTYDEERIGCIPIESNLVPVVDWDNLRIWAADDEGLENLYHVKLRPTNATPIAGEYVPASATMTLVSSPGTGKRVGLALLETHHYYTVGPQDSLAQIAAGIAADFSSNPDFEAVASDASVTVTWKAGPNFASLAGSNGNRITIYGFAEGGSQPWQNSVVPFGGGAFPTKYRITIDFGALKQQGIPTDRVRKLRWTWAADLQNAVYGQTEFNVSISNWTVTGTNRSYSVAGPRSRRIEDNDSAVHFTGAWSEQSGNYSASRIRVTSESGSACTISYSETAAHDLYLGTRLLEQGALCSIVVDGQPAMRLNVNVPGEDVLIRSKIGTMGAGAHTITITHAGTSQEQLFFDFLEIVYPSSTVAEFASQTQLSLATDWDTYHSQSLPAERTAWMIKALGFHGRVNHYVGALWFYEIQRPGTVYASLAGNLAASGSQVNARVTLNIAASSASSVTAITHLVLPDDTAETVALALAALINVSTNLVWASADGSQLTIHARAMGGDGNGISVQLDSQSTGYSFEASGSVLTGGIDGTPYDLDPSDSLNATLMASAAHWRTDLSATPRINRAARDWHRAFFSTLAAYGLDVVAAFSTELMNGDTSAEAGIAQRYPDGSATVLNTPAIQTNFSPASLTYWQQVYLDMAELQASAGISPYLQSGEVQWWYFPKRRWDASQNQNVNVGMPFYDAYTQQRFQARYGRSMKTIVDNTADPGQFPDEVAFLPDLIGEYTSSIRAALKAQFPACRYEVLYPTDVNDTPLNRIINYPAADWTPANLTCLKTESFSFTGSNNLDLSFYSMQTSTARGFSNAYRSHLIGIGDAATAWMKEVDLALAQGLESVVMFALDQYCLIGYPAPPFSVPGRSVRQG